jgi:hypothetical protein
VNGRSSKEKGNRGEREVVTRAAEKGLNAKRAWASDGRALGLDPDIDVTVNGLGFQVKRYKRIASYLTPPENGLGVALRADRGPWLAVIRLDDLLDLIATREKA